MANTIKIGNIEASAIKIGTSNVSAVYIGSTKIYPSGTPTPPTDNWVLVVDDRFTNPRKIKVDYSLIEDDNTEVRIDYELDSQTEVWIVVYMNSGTINYFVEEYGWDQDEMLENYLGMVAVINYSSGELMGILEDGVEYSEIGGTSITEMDYILLSGSAAADKPYLYATE